jgi:hypothetical protein
MSYGRTRSILAKDDNLFVERNGKREQLFPEAGDVFFCKGVEGRILFRYDTSGKVVDALIDRRNNENIIWRKRAETTSR